MDLTTRAARQAGVFSRAQAMAVGYSSSAVDRKLASGQWVRVNASGGIYSHATSTLIAESMLWYAVLVIGQPCALAVGSAAAAWAWTRLDDRAIDVVIPRGRRIVETPLIHLRRLQVNRADITRKGGLPVTTRTRTLADCLRFLPTPEAVRILDRAQQVSRLDLSAVAEHLPARGRGTARGRQLLDAASGEHSAAERLATALLRRAGISGWRMNYRIMLEGHTVVIDIAFLAARVAIEIDGWAFHHDVDAFQRDRRRQNLLVRHGWRVLRFTYRDLVERPDAVVAEILAATRQSTDRPIAPGF